MTSSPAPATRDRLFSVRDVTTIALFAAVISASAVISIPIGAVPITLQVFAVLLAGLLLRPLAAFAAVGVYLLLGAAGVPVFAGFASGIGVLIGPTGGYLFGFAAAALAVALLVKAFSGRVTPIIAEGIACAVGVAVIYVLGWAQLMLVTGLSPAEAFIGGVAPFIVLDIAKAAVAVGVAASIRRTGLVGARAAA